VIITLSLFAVGCMKPGTLTRIPNGVIIEKSIVGSSVNSDLEGNPGQSSLKEVLIQATVKNTGSDGTVVVIASLFVLVQPNEAGKYATMYDATREYLRNNETKTVQFSLRALKGFPYSYSVWCSNSLDDFYQYAAQVH